MRKERLRRKRRIMIKGTAKRPRLVIFRSNKHIAGQIIDDEKGQTLVSAHDSELKIEDKTKTEVAQMTGENIAKKAIPKKIKRVVFDRSGYQYHGRFKAFAEGARAGGLEF